MKNIKSKKLLPKIYSRKVYLLIAKVIKNFKAIATKNLVIKNVATITSTVFLFLFIAQNALHAQAPVLQNENEKQEIVEERNTIDTQQNVIIKQTPDAEKFVAERKALFAQPIDKLIKRMSKTIYKDLKCKEKFYEKFANVPNKQQEVVDSLKKDLKCLSMPNGFLLTSFNIYSKNKSLIDLQYLNTKLTSITIPKYKFNVIRSTETFKVRLVKNEESIRLVRGATDNAELSEIVQKEGFEEYADVYIYVTSDRVIMQLNIYDAKLHRLVWTKKWSVEYNPKKVHYHVGLKLNLDSAGLSFVSLATSISTHALSVMDFGFYFDFGLYSRPYENLTQAQLDNLVVENKIHIGISLGGILAFNFVETITGSNQCCEFSIYARPGILVDVPILDFEPNDQGTTTGTLLADVNFIVPIGIMVSVHNVYIAGDYYPLNTMGGISLGYKF